MHSTDSASHRFPLDPSTRRPRGRAAGHGRLPAPWSVRRPAALRLGAAALALLVSADLHAAESAPAAPPLGRFIEISSDPTSAVGEPARPIPPATVAAFQGAEPKDAESRPADPRDTSTTPSAEKLGNFVRLERAPGPAQPAPAVDADSNRASGSVAVIPQTLRTEAAERSAERPPSLERPQWPTKGSGWRAVDRPARDPRRDAQAAPRATSPTPLGQYNRGGRNLNQDATRRTTSPAPLAQLPPPPAEPRLLLPPPPARSTSDVNAPSARDVNAPSARDVALPSIHHPAPVGRLPAPSRPVAGSTTRSSRRAAPQHPPRPADEAEAEARPSRSDTTSRPVVGYAQAGSWKLREQAALMQDLFRRPGPPSREAPPSREEMTSQPATSRSTSTPGRETRVDEPLLLAEMVSAAIAAQRRAERPAADNDPVQARLTLRAETHTRRPPRDGKHGSRTRAETSVLAQVNHQDAREPEGIEPNPGDALPLVPPTPEETAPPVPGSTLQPPAVTEPGNTVQPPAGVSPDNVLRPPAAPRPDTEAMEEVPPGKPQLSAEERNLWQKIEKYGQLRSIGQIGLNIEPFTHVDPDDEEAAKRRADRTVPGNAAALLLRDQETIRYVSGPPQRSINYSGLLSLADFCHRPLYFQQVNAERYGTHQPVLQPAFSAIQFFAGIPALPYKMTIQRPNLCYYYDHPFEAGRPAPWERQLPPLDTKAGLVQAGVVLGLIFLIP